MPIHFLKVLIMLFINEFCPPPPPYRLILQTIKCYERKELIQDERSNCTNVILINIISFYNLI